MAFIDLMKEKARQNRKTIVLPESEDQRTLTAAAQILKEGTADLILVGNAETIKKDAAAFSAAASFLMQKPLKKTQQR